MAQWLPQAQKRTVLKYPEEGSPGIPREDDELVGNFSEDMRPANKFLNMLCSKALEKGYTPSQIVNQCRKIDSLEKKYGKDFEGIEAEYLELGKNLATKSKELKSVEVEISKVQKKKNDLMKQYYLDEKKVRDYVDAKDQLRSIGFDIYKLQDLKSCVLAIKKEGFNPKEIIAKLNLIGDLEARSKTIQQELYILKGDVRDKKALLTQLRKMQETGLTVEQVERIRDVVAKISSGSDINSDQAFNHFEQDVLKYYHAALGLESEVAWLQEKKQTIAAEIDEKYKSLKAKEREHLDRIKKIEDSYQSQKAEVKAFSELCSLGVDGKRILALQKLMEDARLDFGAFESELRKQGNLNALQEHVASRVKVLEDQQEALQQAVSELDQKKQATELLIVSFSNQFKSILEQVEPQMRNVSAAIEAARTIGRYEAILPLLRLTASDNVGEAEALIAMWNVSNIFNNWVKNHYRTPKSQISEPLKKMLSAIDEEIQSVGK